MPCLCLENAVAGLTSLAAPAISRRAGTHWAREKWGEQALTGPGKSEVSRHSLGQGKVRWAGTHWAREKWGEQALTGPGKSEVSRHSLGQGKGACMMGNSTIASGTWGTSGLWHGRDLFPLWRWDEMILQTSDLHNGISYAGKTTLLYWIRSLVMRLPASKMITQLGQVMWMLMISNTSRRSGSQWAAAYMMSYLCLYYSNAPGLITNMPEHGQIVMAISFLYQE